MSSLKQQLKKIGTLDLRNVSEASRKSKASFLFSAREAADQDLETIYSIAKNGIMELVILDEKFAAFEKTLFSEAMKSVDRILQTKEENDKLDTSINAFLSQLSPYFLLKPSGKVLEYLIRRFRIQDFNVESILKCILPYHETKSFVKMVSILNIDDKSPWEFLKPVKKSLLPLERSLLVKKMIKNRYVFDFICKTVTQSLVPFQTLYSFYAALLTDFIKFPPSVTADMTIALAPHLIDGFKAKKLPELQLASYMIVSQLSSKATFSKEGVEALVDAMLRHYKKSCYTYCLLTVVHVCQTQESFESISKNALSNMINNSHFEQSILQIADSQQVNCIKLLESLVLQGYLSSENVSRLCQFILDGYVALTKGKNSDKKKEFVSQYQSLLAMISQRYVEELDVVLEAHLAASKENPNVSKELYEFTSSAFKGTLHEVVQEANTTLYLCLNSPAVNNRLLALKKLVSIIDDKSNPLTQTPEIFESSLAACLDNFNALFTFAVDEVPQQLLNYVSADKIMASLVRLLQRERGAFNSKDTVSVLKFLLSDFIKKHPGHDSQVARILSVFIFSASSNNLTSLLKRIGPVHLKSSPILASMIDHLQAAAKAQDKFQVPTKFIKLQADLIKQDKKPEYTSFWIEMVKSKSRGESILGMLVISVAVSLTTKEKTQYALGLNALNAVLAAVDSNLDAFYLTEMMGGFLENSSGLPSKDVVKQLRNVEDVPTTTYVQLAQFVLVTLTNSVHRPDGTINWYRSNTTYVELVSKLFKTFVSGSSIAAFEKTIPQLIQTQLSDDLLRFVTSIWSNSDNAFVVRARALQITSAYLGHYIESKNTKVDFQHLVPALLPTLGDVHQSVRVQGLVCLENIRSIYLSQGLPSGHKVYDTTIPTESIQKVKTATSLTILPDSTFYDNAAASVTPLKSNEAAHLVDFVWYRHDEISKDRSYITRLFKEYLDLCEQSKEKQHKARKTHTLTFLLNHANNAPTLELKISMLAMLDSIDSPLKLQLLAPLLEKTLNEKRTKKSTALVSYLIRTYLPCNAADLGSKGDKTLPLFLRLLANKDALQGSDEDGWQVSTRHFALEQITPDFFAQVNAGTQQAIFTSLIDIATNGVQNDVRASKMVLSKLDIDAKMFDAMLLSTARNLMGASATATSAPAAKRGRTNASTHAQQQQHNNDVDLYELVTVLELIESKTISQDNILVKPLFEVLTAMVNADLRDAPVSLEYINQLLMSALTRIIHNAEEQGAAVEESALRVDIVVQCIRITGNPQTHNQALLLMATIASMFPETVLHNIMPVFTFMGANVLRQDDNYSFQVIQQTLEKILPPLVVSSRKSNNDDEAALVLEVKPIIKVFVDALFHIPKHRRLRLFTVLIHTLGEDEFLYAIISLLLEKFTERLAKGAHSEAESLTEFSLIISQQFSPETQMKAILALLNGLVVLPNEKPEDASMSENDDTAHLFNVSEHSARQLRQYKLATLNFVGQLLSSKGFLNKIMAQTNDASEAFTLQMQPFYLQAVEIILRIVAYFTEFRDAYSVSKDAVPGIAKFWRAILKVVYDVLDKVNALLPLDAFVNVISELIRHKDSAIRRKALNIFNDKIVSFDGHAPEGFEDVLVQMISNLTQVIETESVVLSSEEDRAVNKQSALLCIASLAKILGSLYPGQFAEAIPVVIGTQSLQSDNPQLQISSLVCLSVICQEIATRAVPHLPKFMPLVTDLLDSTVNAATPNMLLQLGVVSALETIVTVLPHFVSPYITKMLKGLLHPSIYTYDAGHSQKALVEAKSTAVLSQLAISVAPRLLLTPVLAFYETAIQNGIRSALALLSVVSQAVRNMTRETMTMQYKQLFKFFLIAFDVRRSHNSERFNEAQVNEIEGAIISAFLDLVMKLNETLFKPLFLKVVDWATVELATDDGAVVSGDGLKRVLFCYKLSDALLDKLKSIFTPYFGYLIDDVIMRLERYKQEQQPVDALWNYIMSALRKSFLYDNDNLWNATRFEKIVDPVTDQMLVTSKGTCSDYLARMSTYLVPCVGQMAVTVSNDTLWKPLNHKVLLKTREDDPEIRLAALKCIEEFYIRLGEEWLLFLAESISFLAELMEDDDARVEKLVQQVNAQIETHLGESLDNQSFSNGKLDEDSADLDALQKQLGRMNGLSDKLVDILDSFDGRLLKLEASILPIHRSTQNLTKLANNIDATLKETENIVDCLNMPSKEETYILKGPDENNVLPYLKAMGRLKDGVEAIEKSQLRSCDKTIYQMKQLLKAGMLHLETLFRKWLSAVSNPVDVNTMLSSNTEMMTTASMKQLSQLSTYISSSEKEIGYAVDFTKPYVEIRSAFLQRSLHPLSQSVQLSEKHQGSSYERGSSEFLKYTECYTKMLESEYKFAQQIMSNEQRRAAALKGSIAPATAEYIAAGKQLNAIAKRLSYTETTFVFDIIEKFDRECICYVEELSHIVSLQDIQEMINAFKLTVLRNFYEFMEDVRGRKEVSQPTNLSSDGTVHEMTSNTLNYFKRLYIWRDTVEPLLVLVGDGGWNNMPSPQILNDTSRIQQGESAIGAALLQKFFVDALDQMTVSLQQKSRGYKKPTLATLFLLNNYNHILRQIRSPPLNAIFDDGSEMKFGKLVKKQLDAYQESWKPCVENLMDVTYVRGGAIKNAMGNQERQLIKERFKNFNTEFEEIARAQQTYAIPDTELRNQVIRDVKNVLVPMYGRFLDKYQNTDFTKNPAKYIRYDKDKVDRMIGHLFEPTA
ncbi:hypothetical protein [Parasitella parasitica]|uniref:U3 small nucleolar RNA-associated protein 10 n=1 Tax=Parasitella parasitica TaxID=35722 RepID=A0A0B7N0I9_9FUNG|nr:hypothetical protein [Parasitella parasitica]